MQPPEEPLGHRICKDFLHAFEAFVAGPQPISVTNKELLFVQAEYPGFVKDGDVKLFLKVSPHPKVVVADKIIHGDPIVG